MEEAAAIFTRAFGQWRTGRTTSFGWPAVLTSLLLGFLHVAGVTSSGVAFYWTQMTAAGVGLALWYVRERTGSVWRAEATGSRARTPILSISRGQNFQSDGP